MLRALCLGMTVVLLPLGHAFADAPPDLAANAALKYWQAFATLPKFTDAEQTRLNADCLTMPLDAQARQIADQAAYALQMMHHGAALPRCEWGTSLEEGIHVRLPNGPAARVLCSLACLRARMRLEAGQTTAAIDDIVAGLTLGRHTSLAGTNVMLLVGYAIEHRMMEMLASYVPRLDAPTIKALKARLEALPAGMNTATALATEEKFYLDWLVRKVKEAKDKENLLDLLAFAAAVSEGQKRDARAEAGKFLEDCGGSADGVLKYAEETRSSYTVMVKKLELPLEQFEKEMERETTRQAGNPVFKIFFPALVNVRRAQARTDVRRALLSAALAVQVDGRETLKNHPDPVAGGTFEYVAFEGGFELQSKLMGRDDKPVTLTVGRRGK